MGRGQGYDVDELSNLLTSDHVWAHRVLEQVRQKIMNPHAMRALGFCVGVKHARFMAERFRHAGINAVAISGSSPLDKRSQALRDLAHGKIQIVFAVDLFNEGVDLPTVDTLLLLRPTESPTLFLQSSAEVCARARAKPVHSPRLRRTAPT